MHIIYRSGVQEKFAYQTIFKQQLIRQFFKISMVKKMLGNIKNILQIGSIS